MGIRYARLLAPLALVASLLGQPHAAATTRWTEVWHDSFSGRTGKAPSAANWKHDVGYGWTAGEVQTYTASTANAARDGAGHLRITPIRDGKGNWTSARLETTRSNFAPPKGGKLRISARLKLPAGGQGYWPAFWALGNTLRTGAQSWPANGELDLMENVNNSPQAHGTFHCGTETGGSCNEPNGRTAVRALKGPASSTGYHVYTVIWDDRARTLTYQLDGVTYFRVGAAQVGAAAWNAAMSHGYFLLLNVAVGGGWPGQPNHTTRSGASMLVDYVRVATSR
jgi:beta-glucanase (GH16 family)